MLPESPQTLGSPGRPPLISLPELKTSFQGCKSSRASCHCTDMGFQGREERAELWWAEGTQVSPCHGPRHSKL